MTVSIFIPSWNRVEKQYTWEILPKYWSDRTQIVCSIDEYSEHKRLGRNAVVCPYQGYPPPVGGLGRVRDWIIEHSKLDKIIMLDDDLTFMRRENGVLRYIKGEELSPLFNVMDDLLDFYPMCGISARAGNNRVGEDYLECSRMSCVWGLRKSYFNQLGIRCSDVDCMEDFHTILCFLRSGYKNIVRYDWAYDQRGGSGALGGCASYRSLEYHENTARNLKARHPEFVTLKTKTTKSAWGSYSNGGPVERLDVVVSWKKAYESSSVKRNVRKSFQNS